MTEPRRPSALDQTLLDEGRVRAFPAPVPRSGVSLTETLLDPGRRRPALAEPAEWPEGGQALPEHLAGRYKLIRNLAVSASQAELFLVRVRQTGEEAVLKRYLTARDRSAELESFLSAPHPHVARYLEFGHGYEVMEYLPGGHLLDWREAHPGGCDAAMVREIAQQVSAALIAMHRHGLVHRDIKPVNLMLRRAEPLELVVVDFGIAGPPDCPRPAEQLNPAYQPPEWVLLGEVGVAGDWWSLGMTLLELAAGEHPFEDLGVESIRRHLAGREVDVFSGVPDVPAVAGGRPDRLRNLCRGLLTRDWAWRWGAQEVGQWLVGRDPQLPVPRRPAADGPAGAADPYVFNGEPFHFREELAQAMATAWNHAVEVLFQRDGRLAELAVWLEQFTDGDGVQAGRVVARARAEPDRPGRVRLLWIIRALAPTRPATYRHYGISRRTLRMIAHRALDNDGDAGSVLSDLWEHRLLPSFDAAVPGAGQTGGEALADLDRQWRAERQRCSDIAAGLADPGARQQLDRPAMLPRLLAVSLRAALRHPDDVAAAHEQVWQTEADLPVPVPWFSALARQDESVWVAWLLGPHARSLARTVADRREAERARVEALRSSALFRAWSRRHNRPIAVGWAVVGVCLMAAGWIALIAGSDAVGWADDTAIELAWLGAGVCAALALVVECVFAAEVGGPFHPRYSIPGAGVIALGPLGRWLRRAWLPAAATTLSVLAAIVLLALWYPQAVVVGATAGQLLWVARRWCAWRRRVAEDDAVIAEADRTGPSDTDDVPVGTTRGAVA